jgi:hypothetical protein
MCRKPLKEKLLAAVSSELKALGYEFDDTSKTENRLFEFRKQLRDDTQAIIMFQRAEHSPYGFYVNLIRRNVSGREGYKGFQTRLGWVICIVYRGWRRCPPEEDLWTATNEQNLDIQFADALGKLKIYGIPFLEDPNSQNPIALRDAEITQFQEVVAQVMLPALQQRGYGIVRSRYFSENTVCFGKQVSDELVTFIVLVQGLGDNEEEFTFHVRLFRNRGMESMSWPLEQGHLMGTLHLLLEHKYGIQMGPPTSPFTWRYTDTQDLGMHLEDVLAKILAYALPWLDDPSSENADLLPGRD